MRNEIKVTVIIPTDIPESVRRLKINRIYDILAIALSPGLRYTVHG